MEIVNLFLFLLYFLQRFKTTKHELLILICVFFAIYYMKPDNFKTYK